MFTKGKREIKKLMDKEMVQRIAAKLFNEHLPVRITTNANLWVNGEILDFDGLIFTIQDQKIGKTIVSIEDIKLIRQFHARGKK